MPVTDKHVRMPARVAREAGIAAATLDMNVNEYIAAAVAASNATLAQHSPLLAAAFHHAEHTPVMPVAVDPERLPVVAA